MATSYKSIEAGEPFELVDRKSRFIGRVWPVTSEEEAFAILADVRKANPEARHNVWAYLLKDGRERCSDDGEPQKTSGLPTLEVLRRSGLVDLVAITTRYFGGVLLGPGGLMRAYTASVQGALEQARVVEYTSCVTVDCAIDYALYELVGRMVTDMGGRITSTGFADVVNVSALFREGEHLPFLDALNERMAGKLRARVGEPSFMAF